MRAIRFGMIKTGESLTSMALVTHQDNSVAVRGRHTWNVTGIDRYVRNTLSYVPTTESPGLVTVIISQGEAGGARWSLQTD